MRRSQRMQFLTDLASGRERAAAGELGERRNMLRLAQQQLDQLVHYREDYSHQFSGAAGVVMQGAKLNGYRAFLTGLNRSIEDQNRRIQHHRSECEASVQRWHQTRSRSHALEKVTAGFRRREERDEVRREQRDIDDLVTAFRHCGID